MLAAVLFDLDGTLTDPARGITGSFRHALGRVGHPVADDVDLNWIIGPPLRENFERYGLPVELHERAVDEYRVRHTAVGLFEATLVAGMVEVLDELAANGVALALATAKPLAQARTTLDHVGLADRFAAVAGAAVDGRAQPKAEIVADALRQLTRRGVAGASAMVGDRRHDVDGGRANGCITVAVGWGYAEAGELDAVVPDHRVTTPGELSALLRRLP